MKYSIAVLNNVEGPELDALRAGWGNDLAALRARVAVEAAKRSIPYSPEEHGPYLSAPQPMLGRLEGKGSPQLRLVIADLLEGPKDRPSEQRVLRSVAGLLREDGFEIARRSRG